MDVLNRYRATIDCVSWPLTRWPKVKSSCKWMGQNKHFQTVITWQTLLQQYSTVQHCKVKVIKHCLASPLWFKVKDQDSNHLFMSVILFSLGLFLSPYFLSFSFQRTVFPKDYYVVHHYTKSMLCDSDPVSYSSDKKRKWVFDVQRMARKS